MTAQTLDNLLDRTAAAGDLDADLLARASDALGEVFPGVAGQTAARADTTEEVLRLVDRCVPGWTIHLRGRATHPDGHWHATIRENDTRDSDDVIGLGSAPTAALALLMALLRLAAQKAGD